MGVRILEGKYDARRTAAVLVDSVTETAFGPVFSSKAHAEDFLAWLPGHVTTDGDPRSFTPDQLEHVHSRWVKVRLDGDGDLIE